MQPQKQEISCVVIGAKGVGKTSLISKFMIGGSPNQSQQFDVSWIYNDVEYQVKIKEVTPEAVNNTILNQAQDFTVFVLIYDITSKKSFKKMTHLAEKMKEKACLKGYQRVMVVGNKRDLKDQRKVSWEEGNQFGQSMGFHVQMSAYDQIDIEWVFASIFACKSYKTIADQMKLKKDKQNLSKEVEKFSMASPPEAQLIKGATQYAALFNSILLGAQSTGKTVFNTQLVSQHYEDGYVPTIGIDFKTVVANWKNKNYKLHSWQTSGQDKFQTICTSYYRGSHIFIILYDVSNAQSFQKVTHYLNNIQKFGPEYRIVAIVGNKIDLSEQRKISFEEGREFAQSVHALFFQISCKDKVQVQQCYLKIVQFHLIDRAIKCK